LLDAKGSRPVEDSRPPGRTALIAAELNRYKVDIAALSETRLAEEGSLSEVREGYTFFLERTTCKLSAHSRRWLCDSHFAVVSFFLNRHQLVERVDTQSQAFLQPALAATFVAEFVHPILD